MEHLDLSPQLLAIAAPSQVVLVLTFSMSMPLLGTRRLSLVMPLSSLSPMLEQLLSHSAERARRAPAVAHAAGGGDHPGGAAGHAEPHPHGGRQRRVAQPGDVIVLDHRVGQPAVVSVGGAGLLTGHLGRRGARLAVAVSEHPFDAPPPPVRRTPARR